MHTAYNICTNSLRATINRSESKVSDNVSMHANTLPSNFNKRKLVNNNYLVILISYLSANNYLQTSH